MPLVNIDFWMWFTAKKLDTWKLECPVNDISATVSMPMSSKVGSNLVVSSPDKIKAKSSGGILEFSIPGKLIHFNTIEEFTALDLNLPDLISKYGLKSDIDNCKSTASNLFLMFVFGDLKTYKFHYKMAYF